jgi:hypothetical protein
MLDPFSDLKIVFIFDSLHATAIEAAKSHAALSASFE